MRTSVGYPSRRFEPASIRSILGQKRPVYRNDDDLHELDFAALKRPKIRDTSLTIPNPKPLGATNVSKTSNIISDLMNGQSADIGSVKGPHIPRSSPTAQVQRPYFVPEPIARQSHDWLNDVYHGSERTLTQLSRNLLSPPRQQTHSLPVSSRASDEHRWESEVDNAIADWEDPLKCRECGLISKCKSDHKYVSKPKFQIWER